MDFRAFHTMNDMDIALFLKYHWDKKQFDQTNETVTFVNLITINY